MFKFNTYGADELTRCGNALVNDLKLARSHLRGSEWKSYAPWTRAILNWFSNTASDNIAVDTSRLGEGANFSQLPKQFTSARAAWGESLRIDQLHWRWPTYEKFRYWSADYWKAALASEENLECLLALECEWTGKADKHRYCEVMHEAAKLLSVNAKAKVLVFATGKPELRHELHADIAKLRAKGADASPWLLIDVPHGQWPDAHEPNAHTVAEKQAA